MDVLVVAGRRRPFSHTRLLLKAVCFSWHHLLPEASRRQHHISAATPQTKQLADHFEVRGATTTILFVQAAPVSKLQCSVYNVAGARARARRQPPSTRERERKRKRDRSTSRVVSGAQILHPAHRSTPIYSTRLY